MVTPNEVAAERMTSSRTALVDVAPALDVVPGMAPNLILTSGPTVPFEEYVGGQRRAVIYGALYEGLAATKEEAVAKFAAGEIRVEGCHDHGCIGSVAGIYTASMPVFVVENLTYGNRAYCNFYEGESRHRLNYAVYNDEVRAELKRVEDVFAPVIGEAVRRSGGIELTPLIKRALLMGDELHSRNAAATLLFAREVFPYLAQMARTDGDKVDQVVELLRQSDYFFLRLSMASAKATADAAHGIAGSSIVTAISCWCKGTVLRVSGLGDQWWEGPLPDAADGFLFDGYTRDDIEWIGGESTITETVGLGGFAQAAAFALQRYQGGTPEAMVRNNLQMYDITEREHDQFKIPYLEYRGTPVGIDVRRVIETGITPVLDVGLTGRQGGQIGAGTFRAPIECFEAAAAGLDQDLTV